jgi:DNA adenine methylase
VAEPFLKWAGGKRWLAPAIAKAYAPGQGRYFEPFLGGGAAFFCLEPHRAILADTNESLIDTYRTVQSEPEAIIEKLTRLEMSRATFVAMRASEPRTPVEGAARFIYLNRGAFNGLYRVNRDGRFNVPFGCKPGTRSVDPQALLDAARVLRAARLLHADFRDVLSRCRRGDFIYLDPPYTVMHNRNGFNRYNEALFLWSDQIDLSAAAIRLTEIGAVVVISNADHPSIRRLYPRDLFRFRRMHRSSRMAARAAHRRPTTELLISPAYRDRNG